MKIVHDYLDLIRVSFLVKGVLNFFITFSLFITLTLGSVVGIQLLEDPESYRIPVGVAAVISSFGIFYFIFMVVLTALTFVAAGYLKNERHYRFIITVAILNVFTGFLGVVLCLVTLVQLSKEHVKAKFMKTVPGQ